MDLRQYFRKVRETEKGIKDSYALVSSLETAEGGKQGVLTEVSREIAAKLIAEGRAVLATAEQRDKYAKEQAEQLAAHERAELARRLQVTLVGEPALRHDTPEKPVRK